MQYQTRILSSKEVDLAAQLIRQGECVAFPTETVYGLGANALDERAVAKIYQAKGRPSDNPLIVHCFDQSQVKGLTMQWSGEVQRLMDKYWPGPLTLVLPKNTHIPSIVTGGLDTVALRIPDHPIALALIKYSGLPIAAPSANISGKPSPTRAEHVWQDLAGKIPAIVDGGPTGWGVESTVLDCSSTPFRLLRPGGVTLEELKAIAPIHVEAESPEGTETPRSPGMKYRHYSPAAQVILVVGGNIHREINRRIPEFQERGLKVAVMAWDESREHYPDIPFLGMGKKLDYNTAAARIYDLLRQADELGCDILLIQGLPNRDLGRTIMNRLEKAAGSIIET